MTIQTNSHINILQLNAARPEIVIIAQDPAFDSGGFLIEDEYHLANHGVIKVKALASVTSWCEARWTEPTTVLGVQFLGDERGSWARIRVDGNEVWQGNTNGHGSQFSSYIEITGLTNEAHKVRIEAIGQPGVDGGPIYVGVAAFGWGENSLENKIGDGKNIHLPIIMGNGS